MRTVSGEGKYVVEGTGEVITYPYEFRVFESISDIPAAEMLSLSNRQEKVDCNNETRAKVRSANGHSLAKILTPEQKEANKLSRKADSNLLKLIKAKGLSEADLADLLK